VTDNKKDTLAYYSVVLITTVKGVVVQAPGAFTIKLFMAVIYRFP
jgi:hypothetical protein